MMNPCVATIGSFDGVHLGHRAVLQQLKIKARELNLPLVVVVFEPQPREFFLKNAAPRRILTLRDKQRELIAAGADKIVCLRFTLALSQLSASQFVVKILLDDLNIKHLVIGDDFRFGHKRAGDFTLLQELGVQYGFSVEKINSIRSLDGACEIEEINQEPSRISSTSIRQLLSVGDLFAAENLLGHPYQLSGKVTHGDKRGRQMGFPTLNIKLSCPMAVGGVFAVTVTGLAKNPLLGVANVGIRPTFAGKKNLLEVHLLDFNADCYGKLVTVRFWSKVRAEKKFNSLLELQQQIKEDTAHVSALSQQINERL